MDDEEDGGGGEPARHFVSRRSLSEALADSLTFVVVVDDDDDGVDGDDRPFMLAVDLIASFVLLFDFFNIS